MSESTSKIVPGIVLKSKFCVPFSREFSGYIDYIDRSEAIRTENVSKFSLYNDYMGNPEKTSALFTADCDELDEQQRQKLKKSFDSAQKNGTLMWQNVISFDNKWLTKNEFYNSLTGELNEDKMREATRSAMQSMMKSENLTATLLWSAAVHYNTDNIHIHIAAVETTPTRPIIKYGPYAGEQKGKLKQTTLDDMKAQTYNALLDRSLQYTEITNLIRESIVGDKKSVMHINSGSLKNQYNKILSLLPPNKNSWQYNNKALAFLKPEIDKLTDMYIRKYHHNEYKELLNRIDIEQKNLTEAFGEGATEKSAKFTENKLIDLHTRMGNTILKQMKEYVTDSTADIDNTFNTLRQNSSAKHFRRIAGSDNRALRDLKKALKKDFNSIVNQSYFNRLQNDIDHANAMEDYYGREENI